MKYLIFFCCLLTYFVLESRINKTETIKDAILLMVKNKILNLF